MKREQYQQRQAKKQRAKKHVKVIASDPDKLTSLVESRLSDKRTRSSTSSNSPPGVSNSLENLSPTLVKR